MSRQHDAVRGNQDDTDQFIGITAGSVPVAELRTRQHPASRTLPARPPDGFSAGGPFRLHSRQKPTIRPGSAARNGENHLTTWAQPYQMSPNQW
jgi:hypothetical protein